MFLYARNFAQVSGHVDAARALHYLGEVASVKEHAAAALTLAERMRDRSWLELAYRINDSIAMLEGDWLAARGFSDRGLEIAPRGPALLLERVLLEYQVGDFGQGEAYLARLLEVMRLNTAGSGVETAAPALVIPWVARITGVMHQPEVAEAAAEAVLSSPYACPLFTQAAKVGLALLAVVRGDVAAAEHQYNTLEPSPCLEALGVLASDRLMGLLAQTMGNLDKAAEHFEEALAFSRRAGCRPELAWTCCDYADSVLQRNGLDDLSKANDLLEQALTIATELRMRPLMERVVARQKSIASNPQGVPAYPDGLTEREIDVLRLIASGRTNQEIGDELFISARTVANHVASIFNRTGAANRAEAATYASRNDLI